MRAEERLDEKTRKKTRLRREGIFGSGFVASRGCSPRYACVLALAGRSSRRRNKG